MRVTEQQPSAVSEEHRNHSQWKRKQAGKPWDLGESSRGGVSWFSGHKGDTTEIWGPRPPESVTPGLGGPTAPPASRFTSRWPLPFQPPRAGLRLEAVAVSGLHHAFLLMLLPSATPRVILIIFLLQPLQPF